MTQLADLLKAKVTTLRKGDLNLKSMQLMADTIFLAIENQEVSWEEIGISNYDLEVILKEKLKQEFVGLFFAYQRGQKTAADLRDLFALVAQAITKGQLAFSDLAPFDCNAFFALKKGCTTVPRP